MIIIGMLASTGKLLVFCSRWSEALKEGAPKAAATSYTYAFFLLFLIYPSTCAKIFKTFRCLELDNGEEWLLEDLSIDCLGDGHTVMKIYAYIMILIFPIGTPFFYWFLTSCVFRGTLERIRDKAFHDRSYSKMKQLGQRLGEQLELAPEHPHRTMKQMIIYKTKVNVIHAKDEVQSAQTRIRNLTKRRHHERHEAHASAPAPAADVPPDWAPLDSFDENDLKKIEKIQAACRKRYGFEASSSTSTDGASLPAAAARDASVSKELARRQEAAGARPDWADLDSFDESDLKKIEKIQAICKRRYGSAPSAPPSPPASPPDASSDAPPKSKLWGKVGDKSLDEVEKAGAAKKPKKSPKKSS